MYTSLNYRKIFESEQTGTPLIQKKVKELTISLTKDSIEKLKKAIENNAIFQIPIDKIKNQDDSVDSTGSAYFIAATQNGELTQSNSQKANELSNNIENYIFIVKTLSEITNVINLLDSPVGELATHQFTKYPEFEQVSITFAKSEDSVAPNTSTQNPVDLALTTGEIAAPKAVMTFDNFVSESTKNKKSIKRDLVKIHKSINKLIEKDSKKLNK